MARIFKRPSNNIEAGRRGAGDNGRRGDSFPPHVYANDTARDVFGTNEQIPWRDLVRRAVKKVHDQVKKSARPDLAIERTEYNASYRNEPTVTDSGIHRAMAFGPFLTSLMSKAS